MMHADRGGGSGNRFFDRGVMNAAAATAFVLVVSLTVERSSALGAKCVLPRDGSHHEVDLTSLGSKSEDYVVRSEENEGYAYSFNICRELARASGACVKGVEVCEIRTSTRVGMTVYGLSSTETLGWSEEGTVVMNLTGQDCLASDPVRPVRSQLEFRCNRDAVGRPIVSLKSESFSECFVELWVDTNLVCKGVAPPSPPPSPPPLPPPPPPPPPPSDLYRCNREKKTCEPHRDGVGKSECEKNCG